MIENVILDYNGVISNDFVVVYKTSMQIYDTLGLPRLTFTQFRDRFQTPANKFWEKVAPDADFEAINSQYFSIYHEQGNPQPYDHVTETLETLRRDNKRLIILSSHRKENIEEELRSWGIDPTFFTAIYGDTKDKVEGLQRVITDLGLNPDETAYVGDTEHDVDAGHKANTRTVASTYGYRTRRQLAKAKPDYFIDDFTELPTALS